MKYRNIRELLNGKKIGVLMGGPSPERRISLKSGMAVYGALKDSGLNAVALELKEDFGGTDYVSWAREFIKDSAIDLAFISMHGEFGEDGTLQGILEGLGIPYTGSGKEASRIGIDKLLSKEAFIKNNIPTPEFCAIGRPPEDIDPHRYFKDLGSPVVIKPQTGGSSIGLFIVDSTDDFYRAVSGMPPRNTGFIAEQYICGRELTVGILEEQPLPVVEIIPHRRFFDYEAKYKKGMTEYVVPANIEDKIAARCQGIALKAHRAIGARFFSRADMILKENGEIYILEINTIPGLTETSLLPMAAGVRGIDFNRLTLKILESALW